MAVLSPELRAWLQPGLAGTVATSDPLGQPEIVRVWAARCDPSRDRIEIYVQRSCAQRFLEYVTPGSRAALNLIGVSTYRSRSFKGLCTPHDVPIDPQWLETCLAAQGRSFVGVGLPEDAVERMLSYSATPRAMLAFQIDVDSVYDQSPKKGAGEKL